MATRSMISIKNEDNTYDAVYCHFDGYPDGVGKVLKDNYKTEDIVRELISLGAMSCIKESINECEFYTKRGEPLQNYKGSSLNNLMKKGHDIGCEYLYVFDNYGWTYVAF